VHGRHFQPRTLVDAVGIIGAIGAAVGVGNVGATAVAAADGIPVHHQRGDHIEAGSFVRIVVSHGSEHQLHILGNHRLLVVGDVVVGGRIKCSSQREHVGLFRSLWQPGPSEQSG
jgi:hypothetical protein